MGRSDFYSDGIPGQAEGAIVGLTFVKIHLDTAEESRQFATCGVGAYPIGIAVDSAADEGAVGVMTLGMVGRLLVDGSGSAITEGDFLKADASGYGVKASAGNVIGAMALEPSAAAGDIINVLILPPFALPASPDTVTRAYLTEEALVLYGVPFTDCHIWDAINLNLGATPTSADDLSIITGTYGTSCAQVQGADAKATTKTQYLRFLFPLPAEYVSGGDISVRLNAGMVTTVSDTSAIIDVQCFLGGGTAGSDLCSTAQQSINSLTAANKTFVITPTSRVAGDELDIRVTITVVDGATATAVIGAINAIKMLLDIKG